VVPRSSDRITRVPPYLIRPLDLPVRGCHPLWLAFPGHSGQSSGSAGPRSLATTSGVSVDFLSSGYLDVSVPRVRFLNPMCSGSRYSIMLAVDHSSQHSTLCRSRRDRCTGQGPARSVRCGEATTTNNQVGCPIRRSTDRSPFPAPRGLSQGITSFIASCCLGIHQTPLSRLIRHGKSKAAPPFARRSHQSMSKASYIPKRYPKIPRSVVLDLEQSRAWQGSEDPGMVNPPLGATGTKPMFLSQRCQTMPRARGPRIERPIGRARLRRAQPRRSNRLFPEPGPDPQPPATRGGQMVGRGGLEPPTSRLSGVCSNHLSYRPEPMVEPIGIEPMTS
jgi:hypothetical protein